MHLFSPFDTHLNMCSLYICVILCRAWCLYYVKLVPHLSIYTFVCLRERKRGHSKKVYFRIYFYPCAVHNNLDWVAFWYRFCQSENIFTSQLHLTIPQLPSRSSYSCVFLDLNWSSPADIWYFGARCNTPNFKQLGMSLGSEGENLSSIPNSCGF